MSDDILRIKLKGYNHRLLAHREQLGFSQKEMAEACGVHLASYGGYENLRVSPVMEDGFWRESAKKIAAFLCVEIKWLFPQALLELNKSESSFLLSEQAIHLLSGQGAQSKIVNKNILQALRTLQPREEFVMRHRFGLNGEEEKTHKQIGELLECTKTRIEQIERKSVRRLRHQSRMKFLTEAKESLV